MIRAAGAAAAASLVGVAAHAAAPPAQVDVSRARGNQAEVTLAVDPRDSRILLAGSNDLGHRPRTYASADGGKTWRSAPLPTTSCGGSDPAVGLDRSGRQYYAFLGYACDRPAAGLVVGTRASAVAAWSFVTVPGSRPDKPALAVDTNPASPHVDRVYLAWSERLARDELVLAYSDDGGQTWQSPVEVAPLNATFSSIATAANGSVYVAWVDFAAQRVLVRRSADGVTFGPPAVVGETWQTERSRCNEGGRAIPADPVRCLTASPTAVVDGKGQLHVVYAAPAGDLVEVRDVAFAPDLSTQVSRTVHPVGAMADRFLPTATVDALTGALWVCYYDTSGDPRRRRATFTCTSSADGGVTWAAPRRAASTASDVSTSSVPRFGWGDYEGVAALAGSAHPIWTDTRRMRSYGEEIYTTTLRLPLPQ